MKVVVTGAAGFIGGNLTRHLARTPGVTEVVGVDNLSNGVGSNVAADASVRLVVGDIADDAVMDEALRGASSMVHLAALGSVPRSLADPMATHVQNATGTLCVLEAARRAGDVHTVVASSSSVYGATPDLPKHEGLPTQPMSPYAVSKLASEWYALAFQRSLDLPTLAFRFFNVFGPLQPADHVYAAVIPRFVDAALSGRPVTVHGDGCQTRDFTFVDTVCEVLVAAAVQQVTSPEPVNLAFGSPRSLLEVLAEIEALLGVSVERHHVEPRAGDVRHSDADSTRLTTLFPDILPVEFDQGLTATVDWFRSQAQGSRDGASLR